MSALCLRNGDIDNHSFPQMAPTDYAKKIVNELIVHMHANWVLEEQKGKKPTESTDRVSAKDSLKVKSVIKESPINQKCESYGSFYVPWRRKDLVLI